jgi:hypothetical protein
VSVIRVFALRVFATGVARDHNINRLAAPFWNSNSAKFNSALRPHSLLLNRHVDPDDGISADASIGAGHAHRK